MEHVDVLVLAALPEEFEAAREAATAGAPRDTGVVVWNQQDVDGASPYLLGEYRIDGKSGFTVAVARPTHMGGRATGSFAATLVDRLRPESVAMCGVCAGNPASTALGDVVVGSPVYEWDEGKHSPTAFEGDHQQFSLDPRWLRAAQDFDPTRLASFGVASEEEALLWFLEQLHRGQQPRSHPGLRQYFPSGTWRPRLTRLEEQGFIRRQPTGEAVLTDEGAGYVQRRLYDDVEGPQRLPFRVLAGPMASGSAVVADPDKWGRLKAMGMRKITAIEMEAATIATVAHDRGLPWIVAKGVMDHADTRKDDRYKRFAALASAQVTFALLECLVTRAGKGKPSITDADSVAGASAVRIGPATVVPGAVVVSGLAAEEVINVTAGSAVSPTARPSVVELTTMTSATKPISAEYRNALRSARDYLESNAFSRDGLIRQLEDGEGYSRDASTWAVDSLDVDYSEQAVKSAQAYLESSAFSRRGLIRQLEAGEGFTESQAVYGVNGTDL